MGMRETLRQKHHKRVLQTGQVSALSSTDSGVGAQKGIEQGSQVTRPTTVRRMDLEPGRGGAQKASDGERPWRRMQCFLTKCVCSLTGKVHSAHPKLTETKAILIKLS